MKQHSARPIWGRPITWLVGIAAILLLAVPIAGAQQGTPEASPAASPGASPAATPEIGATPMASGTTVMVRTDPTLGQILTDSDGRTLYVFAKDQPDLSTCTGQCAEKWPPFGVKGEPSLQAGVPGGVGVTVRDDGSSQVSYNGQPLYYYSGDKAPGDTNGQGLAGLWSVVHPMNAFGTPEAAATPAS